MSEKQAKERIEQLCDVSRETMERLQTYADLLEKWNPSINLVSKTTLSEKWQRHFLDSAQVWPHIPSDSKKLVDIGYMHHQRCRIDRLAVRVGLTQHGQNIHDIIARLFTRHAQGLIEGNTLEAQSVMDISHILKRVERFWKDQIRYIY